MKANDVAALVILVLSAAVLVWAVWLCWRNRGGLTPGCRCYTEEGGPYGGAYLVPCDLHR